MPVTVEDRHVLIVRAWYEPGHEEALRVRILQPGRPDGGDGLLLTTRSPEAACDRVCSWLHALALNASSRDGAVTPVDEDYG